MKKLVYLFVLSILLISCCEIYVSTRDVEVKEGKVLLDGKTFNGSLVRIRTIGHPSEQNRVYDLTKIKKGIPVYQEGYSYKKGNFKEITLNTGLKTYMSDLVEHTLDKNFYINYYPDGKIESKREIIVEDNNVMTYKFHGKSEYFDQKGNLVKVEYWEDDKKIQKKDN